MRHIPIYINNFNRLTTTKKLVEQLEILGYTNIHILDNYSTYQPLIEWYEYQCSAKVIPLNRNYGQLAIYNSGVIDQIKSEWFIYTDSDIELNEKTPADFVTGLINTAIKYNHTKVGLALKIDDLPDNQFTTIFKEWEAKYWAFPLEDNVYSADIDTTFHITKTANAFQYKAIRIGGNYTATHLPWYTDFANLSPEEKYYLDHVSEEYSGYKRYYKIFLNQ